MRAQELRLVGFLVDHSTSVLYCLDRYEHERREGNLDAALDGLVDLISHRKRKEQGEMALHLAVHFNQLGAVQCLIQSGSQLRVRLACSTAVSLVLDVAFITDLQIFTGVGSQAICNGDATAMDIAIQLKNEPIQQALAQAASMEKVRPPNLPFSDSRCCNRMRGFN